MKFANEDRAQLEQRLTQLTRQFGDIASSTLNALTGSNFIRHEVDYVADGFNTEKPVLFTIGFTGAVFGEFIFAMDHSTLKAIGHGVAQEDLISETLNVVSGQLLAEFSKVYRRLTMTPPRVIKGQVIYPKARSARALIRGAPGDIECHIYLDHMQLELASAPEADNVLPIRGLHRKSS